MSNEITTEVLAKAIDATKKIVHKEKIGGKFRLETSNEKQDYYIIHKAANNNDSQLNAMAIALIVNGQPDYAHVGIVYAGTNMPQESGANGFGTAVDALSGELSGEYQLAANFLKETQAKVSRQKGTITNVAGFSQAGGYMMKIATEYGRVYGFHTTSFDDWGNHQFDTLTTQEQAWLQKHPHLLTRYQNDSWADYSFRDHTYGNVIPVTGIGEHTTLAAYFDGNMLNLDRLAQAGIFAPQMSKAQVEIAAKNWAQRNGDWNPFTDDNREIKQRVKEYIKLYGSFSIIEFQTKLAKLKQLKKQLAASGGGLSANEKIYLDDRQTLVAVNLAQQTIKAGAASILAIYQAAIVETEQEWEAGLQLARIIGTELNEAEIIAALAKFGTTKESVVTEPSDFYTEKINEIRGLATSFDTLATEIKAGLSILVQKDQELATQLKIGGG